MRLIFTLTMLMFSAVSFADKPEWAGKGKPTDEQKEAHRIAMEAKVDDVESDLDATLEKSEKENNKSKKSEKSEKSEKDKKDKKEKMTRDHEDDVNDDDASDTKKQAGKKADQERKEAGKGSEKGQTKREENSKKWWKFWKNEKLKLIIKSQST